MASPTGGNPVGKLKGISEKQMKTIISHCSNFVETQLLVIAYLDELDEKRSGTSKKKQKGKEEARFMLCDGPTDDDAPGFTIGADETLNRHHGKYSGWKRNATMSLCQFCEPSVFPPHKKTSVDCVNVAKQLLERGWDVDTNEKTSDRPCSLNKATQFANLRAAYVAAGRPLSNITLRNGTVNWDNDGCYEIVKQVQGSGSVMQLRDKVLGKAQCCTCVRLEFVLSARVGADSLREFREDDQALPLFFSWVLDLGFRRPPPLPAPQFKVRREANPSRAHVMSRCGTCRSSGWQLGRRTIGSRATSSGVGPTRGHMSRSQGMSRSCAPASSPARARASSGT